MFRFFKNFFEKFSIAKKADRKSAEFRIHVAVADCHNLQLDKFKSQINGIYETDVYRVD